MRKAISLLLALVLLATGLTGCGKTAAAQIGVADDEIMTYRKLDPDKTTLVVSRTGNISISALSAEFEKQNPDVQVVCIDITGGSKTEKPLINWLASGLAPDVSFWASNLFENDLITEYFTDLSGSELVASYQAEALNKLAINGSIYCLPCPSEAQCIIYNKTLFAQYGWQVPTAFDEFVALCDQITKDTNGEVEPWNPNAKYSNEFQTAMEGFLYEELFGGADNRAWFDTVISGVGSAAEHLKPMYDAVQTLIDHGILKTEHFTYSATERGKQFRAGKIAMINGTASGYESDEYEFGLMPFPSTTGNTGYISTTFSAVMGVPKKERTAAVQDAIDRYLAFFSSAEGQKIFIGDSFQISNVKGVESVDNAMMEALQASVDEGRQFTLLLFESTAGKVNFSITGDSYAMVTGEKTADDCLAAIDAAPYTTYAEAAAEQPEVVAAAADDFTILEASCYIADMYRETAGADIGLIANNYAFRGNLMRIFAGDLTAHFVTVLMPRSLENGSTLVKATVTGRDLLAALNDPLDDAGDAADCVYGFSGIKCVIAPWNEKGQRMTSVTLADGTPIDESKTYTVAFWDGTFPAKYFTDVTDTYEGTWAELMTAKLKKDGTISPAADGRFTLIWD